MAAAGGQPRSKLAFPADHRWTDRQALAGGEGQRRRPPLLGRKSPADQAGSLWEEGPGPAPHQAPEEMAGIWEHALHLIHRLPLGRRQSLHPTSESASAKAMLAYLKAQKDFPGGPVVKLLPVNVGDTGSIPGPGRLHMPMHHNS